MNALGQHESQVWIVQVSLMHASSTGGVDSSCFPVQSGTARERCLPRPIVLRPLSRVLALQTLCTLGTLAHARDRGLFMDTATQGPDLRTVLLTVRCRRRAASRCWPGAA